MSKQAVTITDNDIVMLAEYFAVKDNMCANKEWLLDIFSKHYINQSVIVNADDGENLTASGFLEFLETVCETFGIDKKSVVINTHNPRLAGPFTFKTKTLGVFVGAGDYIPPFKKDTSQARFVGTIVGRFTPTRMRLAYELDQTFPKDNFTIFQCRHWWHNEPFTEFVQSRFDYQPLNRVTEDGRRLYDTPGGKLPSVTTVLEKTKPEEKNKPLQEWRNRVGHAQAQAITTEAANRGTRMHTYLEHYVKTGELRDQGSNPVWLGQPCHGQTVIEDGLKNVQNFGV
jgi:hypothetical protein